VDQFREAVRRGLTDAKKLKTGESVIPLRSRRDFRELVQNTYRVENALEGETMAGWNVTGGLVITQSMLIFAADQWSGDRQLYWRDAWPGARLNLPVEVDRAGTYDLEVVLTKARDYGIAKLALDDTKLGEPIDLYHPRDVVTTGVLRFSGLSLAAGSHALSIEIVGANPAAIQEYMFGLDYIRLMPSATGP
jgi:hypothetical protein